jgi:hypothetical protein
MNKNTVIWNSLEIAKFIVSIVTPLIVLLLGVWINRRLKILEHLQWANQKLIDKRLKIYEELIPLLNDILCYFTYIGCWKELEPTKVIKLKRTVDKIVYVNSPLFVKEFLEKYNNFIGLCYSTYSGWGNDAKLRTAFHRRKESCEDWNSEWENSFTDKSEITDPTQIKKAYLEFVQLFAKEIGIGLFKDSVDSGMIPYNIK